MTHALYSQAQLETKTLAELKTIYTQIGCTRQVADKRSKESWITAIVRYQEEQAVKISKVRTINLGNSCFDMTSFNGSEWTSLYLHPTTDEIGALETTVERNIGGMNYEVLATCANPEEAKAWATAYLEGQNPEKPKTCSDCPQFDPERGCCKLFNMKAKPHWAMTNDCISEMEAQTECVKNEDNNINIPAESSPATQQTSSVEEEILAKPRSQWENWEKGWIEMHESQLAAADAPKPVINLFIDANHKTAVEAGFTFTQETRGESLFWCGRLNKYHTGYFPELATAAKFAVKYLSSPLYKRHQQEALNPPINTSKYPSAIDPAFDDEEEGRRETVGSTQDLIQTSALCPLPSALNGIAGDSVGVALTTPQTEEPEWAAPIPDLKYESVELGAIAPGNFIVWNKEEVEVLYPRDSGMVVGEIEVVVKTSEGKNVSFCDRVTKQVLRKIPQPLPPSVTKIARNLKKGDRIIFGTEVWETINISSRRFVGQIWKSDYYGTQYIIMIRNERTTGFLYPLSEAEFQVVEEKDMIFESGEEAALWAQKELNAIDCDWLQNKWDSLEGNSAQKSASFIKWIEKLKTKSNLPHEVEHYRNNGYTIIFNPNNEEYSAIDPNDEYIGGGWTRGSAVKKIEEEIEWLGSFSNAVANIQ